MNHPLVSVTMSTHNVEEYIADSLESIVGQTYPNLEIICIDDGSKDKTVEIIESFARRDPRIRFIAKSENAGLSVARNEALALANGKYIAFLDGDDLYDKTLFEKAVKCAENTDSDMVLWDYVDFVNVDTIPGKIASPSLLADIDASDKVALLKRPAFTWVKLLRTEKLRELEVRFAPGLTRQDIPVHWKLITSIDKICIIPEKLSYYRQQAGATTHQKNRKLFDQATVMDLTKEYLLESGLYKKYRDEFLRQQIDLLYKMYDLIAPSLKKEALEILEARMGEEQWAYVHSNKPLTGHVRIYFLSLDGSFWAKLKHQTRLMLRSVYRRMGRP